MVIPYVAGMSEDIRDVCRKFNIRVVFKCRRVFFYLLVSNAMWYIVSPAAEARFTLERPNKDWR